MNELKIEGRTFQIFDYDESMGVYAIDEVEIEHRSRFPLEEQALHYYIKVHE